MRYMLLIPEVRELLAEGNTPDLVSVLQEMHPTDAAGVTLELVPQPGERRVALGQLAAALLVEHGAACDRHSLLGLLEHTGTPLALAGTLLEWLDRHGPAPGEACRLDEGPELDGAVALALAHCPPDATLDAQLVERFERARAGSRWGLVGALAATLVERRLEPGLRLPPDDQAEAYRTQQREHFARSARYAREVLGVGERGR